MVDAPAVGLFGGHVSQFAFDQILSGFGVVVGGFGNAEINYFYLSLIGDKYILGINVTMNNVLGLALQVF